MDLEELALVRHARAGTDEGHVTAKDVDQLRELVEAPLPSQVPTSVTTSSRSSLYRLFPLGASDVSMMLSTYARCGSAAVSTRIAELQELERLHVLPAAPGGRTRAVRVALHAPGGEQEDGLRTTSANAAPTRSIARFVARARRDGRRGRRRAAGPRRSASRRSGPSPRTDAARGRSGRRGRAPRRPARAGCDASRSRTRR